MRTILPPLAAAIALCAGIAVAGAQTQNGTRNLAPNPNPALNGQGQPNAPSGEEGQMPTQPRSGSSAAAGSLSHDLSRSGGVIQPPATGDQGVVQPPNQGTSKTPVIRPPGTPGGNQQVQPK